MDNAQSVALKAKLTDIIDEEVDSLRFYYLGNQYKTKIEHIGVDRGISADSILIMWFVCEYKANIKVYGNSHHKECTKMNKK